MVAGVKWSSGATNLSRAWMHVWLFNIFVRMYGVKFGRSWIRKLLSFFESPSWASGKLNWADAAFVMICPSSDQTRALYFQWKPSGSVWVRDRWLKAYSRVSSETGQTSNRLRSPSNVSHSLMSHTYETDENAVAANEKHSPVKTERCRPPYWSS